MLIFYEWKFWANMWCDLWKPVTCRKRLNCKIKDINIIILMFFFTFYGLWTSVTFDSSIRGDPSKKFWKENNLNFLMIPLTQNINFATCDGFSQITSHLRIIFNSLTSDSFFFGHLLRFVNYWGLPFYKQRVLWTLLYPFDRKAPCRSAISVVLFSDIQVHFGSIINLIILAPQFVAEVIT